jgi:hypothetical protein
MNNDRLYGGLYSFYEPDGFGSCIEKCTVIGIY